MPNGLARNPFWLGLILDAGVFDESNRPVLLHDAAHKQLLREFGKPDSKRSWRKVEERDEQIAHTLEFLSWLAYKMVESASISFHLDEARRLVDDRIKEKLTNTRLEANDVLAVARDALLLEYRTAGTTSSKRELRFRHALLRDCFAASAIHRDSLLLTPKILGSVAANTLWWQPLLMVNEFYEKDGWVLNKKHGWLVRSVVEPTANSMEVMLSNALLWRMDSVIEKELVALFQRPLLAGIQSADPDMVAAANRLSAVSAAAFVQVLSPISEQEELRGPLMAFLKSVTEAAVADRTADQLIVHLFDNVYLREITHDALMAIGKPGEDSIVRALRQRPSWGAVQTLGGLRTAAGVDDLLKALDGADAFLAGQIIEALGQIGDSRAVDAVARFARHEDWLIRNRAIEALGKMGAGAIDALVKLALESDTVSAMFIVLAFQSIGTPAVPRLLKALDDKSEKLRGIAAAVFQKLPTPEAVEHLGRRLRDSDPTVAVSALSALVRSGQPALKPLLQYIEDTAGNELLFPSVVAALGKLGPGATATLVATLGHKDPKVRKAVSQALGQAGDPAALSKLAELLEHDPDIDVRAAAAEALGKLNDPAAIPFLTKALEDSRLTMRISVIGGLAHLGNTAARQWLIDTLNNGLDDVSQEINDGVRFAVGNILAIMKCQEAVPILQRLVSELETRATSLARKYAKSFRLLVDQIKDKENVTPA